VFGFGGEKRQEESSCRAKSYLPYVKDNSRHITNILQEEYHGEGKK